MKKRTKIMFTIGIIALVIGFATGVVAKRHFSKEEDNFFKIAKNKNYNKTVVAVVNGEKIYQYEIDIEAASQELSKSNAESAGADSTLITVQTNKEILDELVQKKVILQQAKAQKLTAKFADAQKYVKENYDLIMLKDDENAEFLKTYITELKLTENEYIKLASESYQNIMTLQNFYNDFASRNADSNDLEKLYESYVADLTHNADIEYK